MNFTWGIPTKVLLSSVNPYNRMSNVRLDIDYSEQRTEFHRPTYIFKLIIEAILRFLLVQLICDRHAE